MIGDQWICVCGTHNIELRKKCRECRVPREIAEVGFETALEMLAKLPRKSQPMS